MSRSLMLSLAITAAVVPVAGAQDVAPRLTLTWAEWRCLQPRLDQYLRDPLDPVLASVLGCGQPAAEPSVRRDPLIAPHADENGDPDAMRKVFFLTKTQIVCLKGVIGSLIESGSDADGLILYDLSSCPATAR